MKKLFIGLVVILLILAGWFLKSKVFGERSDSGSNYSSSVVINKSESATTSPTYFTAGTTASSTKIISSELYGKMALNVCLTASTTASIFNWKVEQTDNITTAGTTWFGKLDFTETSNTLRTWGATNLHNLWTPANASASTTCAQLFDMEDFIGVRSRITYNVTGANGAVFLETMIK
jgi:hypothetical protein